MRMVLGQVTLSTGQVVVVDFGLLRGWDAASHGPGAARIGGSAALFDFGGPNAAVLGGAPSGTVQVAGTRTDDQQGWRYLDLILRPDRPVARVETVGSVIVDEARLMIADLSVLGAWQHDEPADGKADVAFWGRDAAAAAAEVKAGQLPEGVYGWADMTVEQGWQWHQHLEGLKQQRGWMYMVDFRPHSHPYYALAQTRASPFGVGHVTVEGAHAFVISLPSGDGLYPVLALRDATGQLLGVRIDLAQDGRPDVTATGGPLTAAGSMPMDPMSAAKASMAAGAADMASNAARRAVVRQIKQYLPKFLWPLIPGEGGSVEGNLKKEAGKQVSNALWGCGCSVAFFLVFGLAVLGFGVVVAWAVYTSM